MRIGKSLQCNLEKCEGSLDLISLKGVLLHLRKTRLKRTDHASGIRGNTVEQENVADSTQTISSPIAAFGHINTNYKSSKVSQVTSSTHAAEGLENRTATQTRPMISICRQRQRKYLHVTCSTTVTISHNNGYLEQRHMHARAPYPY